MSPQYKQEHLVRTNLPGILTLFYSVVKKLEPLGSNLSRGRQNLNSLLKYGIAQNY
jgi:hypothetical protein